MSTQPKAQYTGRRHFLGMCAAGTGLALTGCGPLSGLFPRSTPTPGSLFVEQSATAVPEPVPTAVNASKTTIILKAPDIGIRPLLENFERDNPDISVQYITSRESYQELHNALKYGENVPDLAVMAASWIGQLATFDALSDLSLPPFEAGVFEQAIVKGAWEAGKLQGKRIAIPWAVLPMVMAYRTDMLKEAGIDGNITNLGQRIKSWDDLIALAQEYKQKHTNKAFFGEAVGIFESMAFQKGSGWLDGRKVLIEELGTLPAQTVARIQSLELSLNNGTSSAWDPRAAIRDKEFVALIGSMVLIGLISSSFPDMNDIWRVLPLPGGSVVRGGLFLGIPSRANHPELAWRMARYLATDIESQTDWLAGQGLVPTYKPSWETPLINQGLPYLGGQQIYKLAIDLADTMPGMRFSPYDRDAYDIVNKELSQVLDMGKDPQKAMRDAEAELLRKSSDLVA